MKPLFAALLLVSSPAFALSPAATFLRSLVGAAKGGKSGFTVDKCPKVEGTKWAALLLADRPVEVDYKFAPGCDVQGKVTLKLSPFPVDVEVRNIPGAKRLTGTVSPDTQPKLAEGKIVLAAEMNNGILTDPKGAEAMAFRAKYRMALGLDGKPRDESGGELKVERFRGKPATAIERF